MTAGWFAPPPGSRSGVADYAAAVAHALSGAALPGSSRASARRAGHKPGGRLESLPHTVRLEWNQDAGPVNVYHVGNNQLHREIHARALARPGVVILHDAVLHHFFLGSLDRERYIEEFVFNYGSWTRQLAATLWRERARSGVDDRYFRHPMLKRIAERSLAVVVHNPGAASMVLEHAPRARVVEIPHLFEPEPVEPWEVERTRAGWGARAGTFVFGVFGHLRESKRLMPVLRVFARLRRDFEELRLLVAGEFASSDLERAASPLLAQPGVIRYPYTSAREFAVLAHAADACINLRYPAAGETSGIAIRLMGAGKPVFLTEGPETSRYPEDACLRVEPGPREEAMLEALMAWMAGCPADARAIGERAQAWVRERHPAERVAALYARAIEEAAALVF